MIRGYSLIAAQLGTALVAIAGLAFAPPAQGRMLLLPLVGGAPVTATAVDGGARLIGRGPVAGSLVVIGERGRIASAAISRGILVLSAPALLCGPAAGVGEDA